MQWQSTGWTVVISCNGVMVARMLLKDFEALPVTQYVLERAQDEWLRDHEYSYLDSGAGLESVSEGLVNGRV
jgi:hypothetical protein